MVKMQTTLQFRRSPENDLIYTEIFCAGIKYAEFAFGEKSEKTEKIKKIFKEIMDKAVKFALEKEKFNKAFEDAKNKLLEESKKGVGALGTHEIAGEIEDFLTQGKGLLDLFAKQLLKELFGFDGKWDCSKIVILLKNKEEIDQEVVSEIDRVLKEDWDLWLKGFVDDRNLHHEQNFGLSTMFITPAGPTIILTRKNGAKVSKIKEYIEINYANLFGLVKDLIYLSFCAIYPGLKGIRLNKEYFLPEGT